MKHFVVVSKGEVSTMYVAFQDAQIHLAARQILQRLQARNFIPSKTGVFGPSDQTRIITQEREWFAFLVTLPPGEEEAVAATIIHHLEKLLRITLKRLSDREMRAAAAYTAAIMRHQ